MITQNFYIELLRAERLLWNRRFWWELTNKSYNVHAFFPGRTLIIQSGFNSSTLALFQHKIQLGLKFSANPPTKNTCMMHVRGLTATSIGWFEKKAKWHIHKQKNFINKKNIYIYIYSLNDLKKMLKKINYDWKKTKIL